MACSLLQLEGALNAAQLLIESLVNLQPLLYGAAAVEHGGVVAPANKLADARSRHLGVLLCQIHRHLTHLYIVALAALAEHVLLTHAIVAAHHFENIIDGERMVVYLDGPLDDTLSQMHVDV